MRTILNLFFLLLLIIVISNCSQQDQSNQPPQINTLSAAEVEDGWQLLFDGKSMADWRSVGKTTFPEKGWTIEDGILIVNKGGQESAQRGGDIITRKKYASFDFKFDFQLTEKANSGVKYFVKEYTEGDRSWAIGCEYQLIDDTHEAIANDTDKKRMLGSLYELFEPQNRNMKPIGEWNSVRIYVQDKHVEHWLNEIKILEYERGSQEFEQARLASKFKEYPDFGIIPEGHLLLQDHGDEAHYRNIKIKEL